MYSNLVNCLIVKPYGEIILMAFSYNLRENIQNLNALWWEVFDNLSEMNLFTLKFRLLAYVVKDKRNVFLFSYLDGSLFKNFNVVTKIFINMTYMKKTSTPKKQSIRWKFGLLMRTLECWRLNLAAENFQLTKHTSKLGRVLHRPRHETLHNWHSLQRRGRKEVL